MKPSEKNHIPEGGVEGMEGKGTGRGMSQKLNKDDAEKYLNEVKEIFHDQKEKYSTFLHILKDFRCQRTDVNSVIAQVKELLKDHKNLIYGFNMFLPKGYEISLDENEHPPKQNVEFDKLYTAKGFINRVKERFQNDENVFKSFLDILMKYENGPQDIIDVHVKVAALFEDHPDLFEEFTGFLPGSLPVAYFIQDDITRGLLPFFHNTKRSARNKEELASSDDRDTTKSSSIQTTGLKLCEKVKERLGNLEEFLQCLHLYSNGIIERNDLQNLVTELLGKHPDLMNEFNQFLGAFEYNIAETLGGNGNGTKALKSEDEDGEEK